MATSKHDYYKMGDVFYAEKPFVRIVRHDLWNTVCTGCFRNYPVGDLKKCGACKRMKFCGLFCQKKAWPNHKLECKYLRNYTDYRHQLLVQMVGNVILKLKDKDWKTVTCRVFDKEISLDDIKSHPEDEVTKLPRVTADFQAMLEPLTSYIGKENMPNMETLEDLFGKVYHHKYMYFFEGPRISLSPDGWSFFIGASKLDQSCVPNAVCTMNASSFTIRPMKTIQKSEKVTVSHRSMINLEEPAYLFLHDNMKENYREFCNCNDCSQPFGTSDLTKILDASKASDVLEETACLLLGISNILSLLPLAAVKRDKLVELSQKQAGVLGRTNLRRMQVLNLLHSHPEGPTEERKRGLIELAETMKEVWGEYFPELMFVYKTLIELPLGQKESSMYLEKISQIEAICYGKKPGKNIDMLMCWPEGKEFKNEDFEKVNKWASEMGRCLGKNITPVDCRSIDDALARLGRK